MNAVSTTVALCLPWSLTVWKGRDTPPQMTWTQCLCALRYATVYGERQHHRGVNALHIIASYERIKAGQPPILPGDGREGHDYIYVGDVARATIMAMASKVTGE